jgi:hypothetical protein
MTEITNIEMWQIACISTIGLITLFVTLIYRDKDDTKERLNNLKHTLQIARENCDFELEQDCLEAIERLNSVDMRLTEAHTKNTIGTVKPSEGE